MRNTMRTTALLLLGIALAGTAACGGATGEATGPAPGTEPPAPPTTPSIAGTYTLQLVNDSRLPFLLWHDDTAYEMDAEMYILSGSIVLRPDGTFRSTSVSQLVIAGDGVHPGTDMVETSITDGTWKFEPDPTDPAKGVVGFTAENGGGEYGLYFADFSIRQHVTIPGAPGESDIQLVKLYIR